MLGGKFLGFFNDDGTKINPELVPKPSLCLTCKQDDNIDPEENMLCILNRADQMNEGDEFKCGTYEKKQNNEE